MNRVQLKLKESQPAHKRQHHDHHPLSDYKNNINIWIFSLLFANDE